MSLLFNMLIRLVITFFPKSKCLLISWLQSLSAVILELKKIKSVTVSILAPSICHEVMGPDAMIFGFYKLSRLVISFIPRSKHLLIPWLQSPSAVILEPPKIKSATVSPSICYEVTGPDAMILVSECCTLSQLFHSPLSLSSRGF